MKKKKLEFPSCPNCWETCNIYPISSFDPEGKKFGGIFRCSICGWFDFDNIISPEDIKKFV